MFWFAEGTLVAPIALSEDIFIALGARPVSGFTVTFGIAPKRRVRRINDVPRRPRAATRKTRDLRSKVVAATARAYPVTVSYIPVLWFAWIHDTLSISRSRISFRRGDQQKCLVAESDFCAAFATT